jgi:outer membrane protein TolC
MLSLQSNIVSLCLLAAGTQLFAAEALTLEEASRIALAENPQIKAARARWTAAKARVPQAAAWEDLQVGLDVERVGTTQFNTFSDVEYMASQKVPISGKNRSQARIAEADAAEVFQQLRRAELNTLSKVRAAWYRMANARAQRSLSQTQADLLKQVADAARIQFEANTREQTDVLTAETEIVKVRDRSVMFDQDADIARAEMSGMMARSSASLRMVGDLPNWKPRTLVRAALDSAADLHRPEIAAARAKVRAAEAGVQLARRNWIPDPELRVEARRMNDRRGIVEYDTGVFFNVPWLNGRKYRAAESEAENALVAARADVDAARFEAQSMIGSQLARLAALQSQIELSRDKFVPIARQTLEANRVGFEAGRTGIVDLLISARSVREAEAEMTARQSEYFATLAELEAVVGAPLTQSQKLPRPSK